MSDDLSLTEAAKHIGIPSSVLHAWTWAHCGPKPIGKSGPAWKPRYRTEDLNAWLREQGVSIARSIG